MFPMDNGAVKKGNSVRQCVGFSVFEIINDSTPIEVWSLQNPTRQRGDLDSLFAMDTE